MLHKNIKIFVVKSETEMNSPWKHLPLHPASLSYWNWHWALVVWWAALEVWSVGSRQESALQGWEALKRPLLQSRRWDSSSGQFSLTFLGWIAKISLICDWLPLNGSVNDWNWFLFTHVCKVFVPDFFDFVKTCIEIPSFLWECWDIG